MARQIKLGTVVVVVSVVVKATTHCIQLATVSHKLYVQWKTKAEGEANAGVYVSMFSKANVRGALGARARPSDLFP